MMIFLLILAALAAAPFVLEYRRRVMDDAARGSATGQFVELSEGVTHFQWYGPAKGPLVVCVHGLTTPSFVWRSIATALALSGYRVLTYDLYGRGFSSRPKRLQDQAFFLQQLVELLAHERVSSRFMLMGYSMGGAISACFAAAYPERVSRLVLLAPAGMNMPKGRLAKFIRDTPWLGDWLFMALYPAMLRKGIRAEYGLATSVDGINAMQLNELTYRGFLPAVLSSLRGLILRPLMPEHKRLAQHDIPVLAIWGREDDVIPLSAVGTLAEWNRNAHQEVIDGAGHGLTYTHTDQVLSIMQEWIKTIGESDPAVLPLGRDQPF